MSGAGVVVFVRDEAGVLVMGRQANVAGGQASLDPQALFSDQAMRALTRHAVFRSVAEALAAEAIRHHEQSDAVSRWLLKDLGRSSIYAAALVLHGLPGELTTGGLISVVAAGGVVSRGRVISFVDHALRAGRVAIAPGSAPWTQRLLIPHPVFIDEFRQRVAGPLRAMSPLAPSLGRTADRLSDDSLLALVCWRGGQVATQAERLGARRLPTIEVFLHREGGMRVLQALLLRQDPTRERLLEVADLSRVHVARAAGVSRMQVNLLLKDAEALGVLAYDPGGRIHFHPSFNESYELWVAMQVQGARLIAETVLGHQT